MSESVETVWLWLSSWLHPTLPVHPDAPDGGTGPGSSRLPPGPNQEFPLSWPYLPPPDAPAPVCVDPQILVTWPNANGGGAAPVNHQPQTKSVALSSTGSNAMVGLDSGSNIADLSKVIMSEASIGNQVERTAVGFTVVNRMLRNKVTSVSDVWGTYAHRQTPIPEITSLSSQILSGKIPDPTSGATHFYSPLSMPREGDPTSGYDVGGGLERVPPLSYKTYRPSWSLTYTLITVAGTRPAYYKFYRMPNNGPVS